MKTKTNQSLISTLQKLLEQNTINTLKAIKSAIDRRNVADMRSAKEAGASAEATLKEMIAVLEYQDTFVQPRAPKQPKVTIKARTTSIGP